MTWWTILRAPGRISDGAHETVLRQIRRQHEAAVDVPLAEVGLEGFGHRQDRVGSAESPGRGEGERRGQVLRIPFRGSGGHPAVIVARSAAESEGSPSYALQVELTCQGGIFRWVVFTSISFLWEKASAYVTSGNGPIPLVVALLAVRLKDPHDFLAERDCRVERFPGRQHSRLASRFGSLRRRLRREDSGREEDRYGRNPVEPPRFARQHGGIIRRETCGSARASGREPDSLHEVLKARVRAQRINLSGSIPRQQKPQQDTREAPVDFIDSQARAGRLT